MYILENVPLNAYSTMRLGGPARYLTDINTKEEIAEAVTWAEARQLPVIMIGEGSNIVWTDTGFPGLVLVNKITGFESFNEDDTNLYLTIGAGEVWDDVVKRTVEMGYTGIEQLSLIPGTAGATPVQNVGAYGREIAEVLVSCMVYDKQTKGFINMSKDDCNFAYRTSRFKTTDRNRFFIATITLHLLKANPVPPFYEVLQTYLSEHNITAYTPSTIRDAVIQIRTSKMPDPKVVANNGSFFSNPIISEVDANELREQYPDLVSWKLEDDRVKLSAAWLVEQAGFKGVVDKETGMGTWPKHALVLINERAGSTANLLAFKKKITDAVQAKFGVALEQEPELIGG